MHYLLRSFRDTAAGARGSFSQTERREGCGSKENREKSQSRMETCCHIESCAFVLELSRSKCHRLPSGLLILEIDRLVQLRTVSATWYDVHESLELSNECVPTVICCLRRAKQITIDVAVALCFNPVWCYEIVTVSHLGDTFFSPSFSYESPHLLRYD